MTSPVFDSSSLPYVEEMFSKFQNNPASVGAEWHAYFSGWLAAGGGQNGGGDAKALGRHLFTQAWRTRGHLAAHLSPICTAPTLPPELKPETYGLTESDLDTTCKNVRETYGKTTGIETEAVADPIRRAWVQTWWEDAANRMPASAETRKKFMNNLIKANGLERFLHTKFVGAKRFSIEGTDAALAMMAWLADTALATGGRHMVLGMAHRGRLNTLCNLLHKPLEELFAAFADKLDMEGGPSAGDVKYHMGKTYTLRGATGGEVELDLLFNPSHLEAVNPAVIGKARAKAELSAKQHHETLEESLAKTISVMVHGDSAVVGQGTVAEAYVLSSLPTYQAGGTLHIVTNNQIGFTADPHDAFGYSYCTDGFKATGHPIVHVNADDADACLTAIRFAWEYRQTFQSDVMLDVVGYRRWGHNEGDDPTFTQPQMYDVIRSHPVPADVYKTKLLAEGTLTEAEAKMLEDAYGKELTEAYTLATKGLKVKGKENPALKPDPRDPATVVKPETLEKIASTIANPPKEMELNSKVAKALDERAAMLKGEKPLNWGAAEVAAYATLLMEKMPTRLTGQDVQRGTFSHRHAVVVAANGAEWNTIQELNRDTHATFAISALSEFGVLMYEYGYALGNPAGLTIWEAQFGDFANGAQVAIDQFVASAAAKWGQANGLTILLPHGMEGQGPEHSSARVERFLQLAAEDNLSICVPSTPAQMFHLLRRQAMRNQRKPLVVFTPKSLLRHPLAVSEQKELTSGSFQPLLTDPGVTPSKVKKVIICSGKVYYDLLVYRERTGRMDTAILRLEELYPLPEKAIAETLKSLKTKDIYWVQEEPRNTGPWWYVRENWNPEWGYLHVVSRPNSASPAVGTTARHNAEQQTLLETALGSIKAS